MIQTPLHALGFDAVLLQHFQHFTRNLRTADIRILLFVIMVREAVETIQSTPPTSSTTPNQKSQVKYILIYQLGHLRRIHLHGLPVRLPMRGEHNDSFRLDARSDFFAYLGQFAVCWVFDVEHD